MTLKFSLEVSPNVNADVWRRMNKSLILIDNIWIEWELPRARIVIAAGLTTPSLAYAHIDDVGAYLRMRTSLSCMPRTWAAPHGWSLDRSSLRQRNGTDAHCSVAVVLDSPPYNIAILYIVGAVVVAVHIDGLLYLLNWHSQWMNVGLWSCGRAGRDSWD